jgi:tripeptide aminopeptidase
VAAAREAVRAIGLAPRLEISNGGLDANWMAANGIPTVTLGCGQMEIHTTKEQLDLGAFEAACEVALRLALGQEPRGSKP